MSIVDRIAAVLLSFLMSLFCFIFIVCIILSCTFSQPSFMTGVLEKRQYYDAIFYEYCDAVEGLAIPAGVDEGIFSSVVSEDEFKENINNIVYSAYNSTDSYAGAAFDYDSVYQRFYNCMADFAESKEIEVTDEIAEGLDNVADLCASTCQVYVTIPFIDTIGAYASEFGKYLKIGALISGVLFMFMCVVLFTSKKWRRFSFKPLPTALIADGFMLAAAPAAVLLSGKIRYIQVEVKSLYHFAVGYIEHLLYTFITVGAVLLAVGVLTAVIFAIIRSKRNRIG